MPVGSTVTYTVTGTVSASATGTLVNTATVATPAGVTDPTPSNNTATDTDAPAGVIKGVKYRDVSGNGLNLTAGMYSPADVPMSGVTIYLDLNNDGDKDNNEPSTTTLADTSP